MRVFDFRNQTLSEKQKKYKAKVHFTIEALIWGLLCGREWEVYKHFCSVTHGEGRLEKKSSNENATTVVARMLQLNKLPITLNNISRDSDSNDIECVYTCNYCGQYFINEWYRVREGKGCRACLLTRYPKIVSLPESIVLSIFSNLNMFACIDAGTGEIDKSRIKLEHNSGRKGTSGGVSREDIHIDKGIVRLGTPYPIMCKTEKALVVEIDSAIHVNSKTDLQHVIFACQQGDDLFRYWCQTKQSRHPPCIFITLLCVLCDYDCAMSRYCYLDAVGKVWEKVWERVCRGCVGWQKRVGEGGRRWERGVGGGVGGGRREWLKVGEGV